MNVKEAARTPFVDLAFNIALGVSKNSFVAGDRQNQAVAEGLRREFLRIRDRLNQIWSRPAICTEAQKAEPLAGYYTGAFDRVSASAPIVSLSKLSSSDHSKHR